MLLTTADEAGERKELVYNNEVLQTLLTIAGIKLRRARPMVESIMQQLSTEAHKDAGHRLIECTSTPKDDGTVSVELKWFVPLFPHSGRVILCVLLITNHPSHPA